MPGLLLSASEVKKQLGKQSSLPSPALILLFLGLRMQTSSRPLHLELQRGRVLHKGPRQVELRPELEPDLWLPI